MRWGIRKQHAAQSAQGQAGEESKSKRKSKGKAFFSPLSWLAKLTAKPGAAAKASPKHALASTPKNGGAASAFPSCLPKRTSPSPVMIAPGLSSPPHLSPDAAGDVVPRRLSVGNDDADAVAARRHCSFRRHCSLGGDRDLRSMGHLIPFSLAGSPAQPPAAAPSDTDAGASRLRRQHRRRHPRRSLSGGRRSFSGRMPLRVRVQSPRRAPELERFAVVRRTRDPQRAFRESMVEMIASSSGVAARPEELERLLACYLSLNADEHHDCIVKVFRQVWFEYINLLPRPDQYSGSRPARR